MSIDGIGGRRIVRTGDDEVEAGGPTREATGVGPAADIAAPEAPEAPEPPAVAPRATGAWTASAAAFAAEALAAGATTRKSRGPEGEEPLLSPVQVRRVEKLLARAPAATLAAIQRDLERIGGRDAPIGRALYLKAAAARADALGQAPRGRARTAAFDVALQELADFAERLDGMSRDEMLRRASVLDLDSRVSTSDVDPEAWDEKRGVIAPKIRADEKTDNDGLFQRFMEACGATTLQMALCEEDPIRAFAVHDAGIQEFDDDPIVGRFQKAILAEANSRALTRRADYNMARFHNGLGRLNRLGDATKEEIAALRRHVHEDGPLDAEAKRALRALRGLANGFPTNEELAELRAAPKEGDGIDVGQLDEILGRHLGPITGREYRLLGRKEDGFEDGEIGEDGYLDRIAASLKEGYDVPFGISEPPHWMFMSAVSGEEPDRRFLVTDPWAGRTRWVTETALVSGDFIVQDFKLDERDKGGFIDFVFLPAEA